MENEGLNEYDENKAIEYINEALSAKGKSQYDEDDLLLLIDAMFDYFDENDDFDSDIELDEDIEGIVKYVSKVLSKDSNNSIALDDVKDIVLAELEYENSLDI